MAGGSPHEQKDPTDHGCRIPLLLGRRARIQDPCVCVALTRDSVPVFETF